MKFLIKPQNQNVMDMYKSHSTYHKGDSGLDLFTVENITIQPGETLLVDLGIQCQLRSKKILNKEKYHSYFMLPRSSISKTPLRLANSIGLIDSEYLGNIKAALQNTSTTPFTLNKGERYVQLVRGDLGEISFKLTEQLRSTDRTSGFGSTGK